MNRPADDVTKDQLTREAARVTDAFVHENPWTAIGIAAGVVLIIGLLSSRG